MNSDGWLKAHDKAMERLAQQHEPFKVKLAPARSGDWELQTFEVKPSVEQLRYAMDGRPVPLGEYTRLVHHGGGGLFMTDTPAELNDARVLFWAAMGHVLITGLGIGMLPRALFNPAIIRYGGGCCVEKVTIVEKSQDVINLVAPSLAKLPVEIVHADAFEWKPEPGTKFDWAWHDIWPTICSDNLGEVAKLRNHYKRFMVDSGRQLVWCESEMKKQRRESAAWL